LLVGPLIGQRSWTVFAAPPMLTLTSGLVPSDTRTAFARGWLQLPPSKR
jgi:hypothetical protein